MVGESGWCQCSLLKQGRKGSRLQGGLLICNVCDLPILEGAAARAVFSGDEAAELVPTNARVGAVATEPTFDSTGLGVPNSTSPGWYPDPETPDHWRYWDGAAWTGQRRRHPPPRWAVLLPVFVVTAIGIAAAALVMWPVSDRPPGVTPPGDAAVSSAAVPVGAVVQSTGGDGLFRVEVVSIKCDWYFCTVSTTITNTGTDTAEFPCWEVAATDSAGSYFTPWWPVDLYTHDGCRPPTLQPGETASVPMDLGPSVHDRQLVTLIVPGADQQIDLPEVNR